MRHKRKIGLLMLIMLLIPLISYAALDGGVISVSSRTNTQVLVQITTAPSGGVLADSVNICKIVSGASDTTFITTCDTLTTAKIVTGIPNQTATYFLVVRGASGEAEGLTAISNEVSVTTYGPEIESVVSSNETAYNERVITATSWRPYTETETFTINGESATDSSAVYTPWEDNSITVIASQAGDSVKVMLYVYYGSRTMTQTGATQGFCAASDSLNITGPGIFGKTLTSYVAAPSMYFSLGGYADNGKNTSIVIWLNRRRYAK